MKLSIHILAYVVIPTLTMAQQVPVQSDRPNAIRSRPNAIREGKITLELHQSDEVPSLGQLIKVSKLILEGTILSIRPSVRRNDAIPDSIETHSIIAVHSILAGTIPDGGKTIVLAEEGGTVDRLEVSVEGNLPVQTGDRYILFLSPDTRKKPDNDTGFRRYYVVGSGAGKIKIEGQKVRLPARAATRLKDYDNTEVSSFLRIVDEHINHRPMPTKINVVPNPGLPGTGSK